MVLPCSLCGALRFPYESPTFCCSKGEVILYPITVPQELVELYTGSSPAAIDFMKYIRAYNSVFAFTSFGVNLDPEYACNNKGIYTFRAQGQIYHRIDGLNPLDEHPAFLQLYFYDTAKEVEHRMYQKSELEPTIVSQLIKILEPNPYSKFFRNLNDLPNIANHQISLKADPEMKDHTASAPTASQVAAMWIEDPDAAEIRERDIMVHSGHMANIRYYYGCYDSLQYPLLFPLGEPGWHRGIKRRKRAQNSQYLLGQGNVLPAHASTARQLLQNEETG